MLSNLINNWPPYRVVEKPEVVPMEKQARKDKEQGKEGSQAISQKDERSSAKRAKDDHPEAPEPIIGMQSGKISPYSMRGCTNANSRART